MFVYYCPPSADAACGPFGFWRIARHQGFCRNVTRNETAMQTCESGVGANTPSATPDKISLRAKWYVRTETASSISGSNQKEHEWTFAQQDSVWFSRKAVPCAADYSTLTGQTKATATNGQIIFEDMRSQRSRDFVLRFSFGILGSDASFTEESEFKVTQGQIGGIDVINSPELGLVVGKFVDPPIMLQPIDLFGNPIRGWNCDDNPSQSHWRCMKYNYPGVEAPPKKQFEWWKTGG